MSICYYCYTGFNTEQQSIDYKILFDINNLKTNLAYSDILIGSPPNISECKNFITEDDFNTKSVLEKKLYLYAQNHGAIKSILITNVNFIRLWDLFSFEKIFDENIDIYIINPNIDYLFRNKPYIKYIYSIYSIYKQVSRKLFDIYDAYEIDNNFNMLLIKRGTCQDSNINQKIQNISDLEQNSTKFNSQTLL